MTSDLVGLLLCRIGSLRSVLAGIRQVATVGMHSIMVVNKRFAREKAAFMQLLASVQTMLHRAKPMRCDSLPVSTQARQCTCMTLLAENAASKT